MNTSIGVVLVVGIVIICGVFVFADSIAPVIGGKNTTTTPAPVSNEQNTSMQAELLVRFSPELWNTTVLQSAAKASHTYIGATVATDHAEFGLPGLQLVRLPPGMTVEEGITYYQNLPYVQYAERNAVYSIESIQNQTHNNESIADPLVDIHSNTTPDLVRLLVQFNVSAFSDNANLSAYVNQTHHLLSATLIRDFTSEGLSGLHLVELPMNMTAAEGIGVYKNQSSVVFAEPDYPVSVSIPIK